jgi:hypothetical protein
MASRLKKGREAFFAREDFKKSVAAGDKKKP